MPHSSFDFDLFLLPQYPTTATAGFDPMRTQSTAHTFMSKAYSSIQDVSIFRYEVKCCNCRTFQQDFAVQKMFLITTNAPSRLRTVRLNTSEINLPFFVSSSVRQSGAFFISFLPTLSASGKSHQIPSRAGEPLGRLWDREDLSMNGLQVWFQGSDFPSFSFCLWNMNDDY